MGNKKVLGLLMAGVAITCLTGCGNGTVDGAISKLNKEYGETFTYRYTENKYAANGLDFYVECESYPGKKINVESIRENGQIVLYDGYLGLKYEEQTRELLQEAMEEALGTRVYVKYNRHLNTMDCPSGDMTFDEYIQKPEMRIGFCVITDKPYTEEEQKEIELAVENALIERNICCIDGRIYFDDGSGHFDDLYYAENKSEEAKLYLYHDYYNKCFEFYMEDTTGFSKSEWRNRNGE